MQDIRVYQAAKPGLADAFHAIAESGAGGTGTPSIENSGPPPISDADR